jgi:hypothetical protein
VKQYHKEIQKAEDRGILFSMGEILNFLNTGEKEKI